MRPAVGAVAEPSNSWRVGDRKLSMGALYLRTRMYRIEHHGDHAGPVLLSASAVCATAAAGFHNPHLNLSLNPA